jgi:hypothetical protein
MVLLTATVAVPVTVEGLADTTIQVVDTLERYSNVTVVANPLAFTLPFKVADEFVLFVIASVVAVGIFEFVVKLCLEPYPVPFVFNTFKR